MNPEKALFDKAAGQSGDCTLTLTVVEIVREDDEVDVEEALAAVNSEIRGRDL